jgi:antitoxin VapB
MPISIKNEETEQLARNVADLMGKSLTDAIRISLKEQRERLIRQRPGRSLRDELKSIATRCSELPVTGSLTDDEILGYDEFGIPSR